MKNAYLSFVISILVSVMFAFQLSAQNDLTCTDAENAPQSLDCTTGANETGDPGDGTADAELTGCLNGADVTWNAYQFPPELLEFEFDGMGNAVLFEGPDCGNLTEIECGASGTFPNDPTMTYFVAQEDGEDFEIVIPAPPANEDCNNAATLSGSLTNENNSCASPVAGSCGGDHSVWYEITVSAGGTTLEVEITGGTIANAELDIFDACPGSGGVSVATNGACSDLVDAECLAAGTYYVEVSSASGDVGTFDISETKVLLDLQKIYVQEP